MNILSVLSHPAPESFSFLKYSGTLKNFLSLPFEEYFEWCQSLYMTAAAAAAKSLQSCPTLCDPMDCSLPGSSVHGIFQARVLEWGAIAFSALYDWHLPKRSWYLLRHTNVPIYECVYCHDRVDKKTKHNKTLFCSLLLDQEFLLEKGVATHSSILAWIIPWTKEPDRLQSRGITKSQTLLSD